MVPTMITAAHVTVLFLVSLGQQPQETTTTPPGPAAIVQPVVPQKTEHLLNAKSQAEKACGWKRGKFGKMHPPRWGCDEKALSLFQVEQVTSVSGDSPVRMAIAPVSEKGCVRALMVLMEGQQQELVVDWSHVTLVFNGRAIQSVPGFARRINAGLQQKSSVAPVGTKLDESVFPIDDEACLAPANPPAQERMDEIRLVLPHTVGGTAYTAEGTIKRRWLSETEAVAFSVLKGPRNPGPSTDEPKVGLPILLWGLGAAAVSIPVWAAASAALAAGWATYGYFFGYGDAQHNLQYAYGESFPLCWCCAFAPLLSPLLLLVVAVGAVGDIASLVLWGSRIGRSAEWVAHEQDVQRFNAFRAKRAELGLDNAPEELTPNPTAP